MKKKNRLIWIVTILSLILSAVSCVSIVTAIARSDGNDTIELGRLDYVLGTVSESGELLESKKTIRSRSMHTLEGLEVDLKDNSTVTYKLVYYDVDEKYLSTSDSFKTDFTADQIPEGAVYFRILITPYQIDGEDVELTIWNMGKYINQIEVTCNE